MNNFEVARRYCFQAFGNALGVQEERDGDEAPLTVRETARVLGMHENTVRNWEGPGLPRAVRLPTGVRRFDPNEVERLRAQIFAPAVEGPTSKPVRHPGGRFVRGDDV